MSLGAYDVTIRGKTIAEVSTNSFNISILLSTMVVTMLKVDYPSGRILDRELLYGKLPLHRILPDE